MTQKMKVALTQIKQIQSEIQKILHFHKNQSPTHPNPNQSHHFMKMTYSSGIKKDIDSPTLLKRKTIIPPMSPNKFGKKRKSTGSEQMKKVDKNASPVNSPYIKKKDPEKVSEKSKKSKKNKKDEKTGNDFQIKLAKIEDHNKDEVLFQQNQKKPRKLASNSQLMRKWTVHEKSPEKEGDSSTPIKRNLTIDMTKVVKQLQYRSPFYSPQSSDSREIKTSSKKQKKQKSQSSQKKQLLSTSEKKINIPYHLDSKNKKPLRTETNYLSQKYAYKPLKMQDERQKTLKMKYHVLDQRLQKIKDQFHTIIKLQNELKNNVELKLNRKQKKSLSKYMKYSPLSKLVRINQKYKIQHQRSLSQNIYRTKQELEKKKNPKIGRPLWET